jgi:hypothetical protein
MSDRDDRGNALGWALLAVPFTLLAYALLGFGAVEILQWITRSGGYIEPGWIREAREYAAEWSLR